MKFSPNPTRTRERYLQIKNQPNLSLAYARLCLLSAPPYITRREKHESYSQRTENHPHSEENAFDMSYETT